jgi:hypothetical protein
VVFEGNEIIVVGGSFNMDTVEWVEEEDEEVVETLCAGLSSF